jgi:hypothetical protein
MRISSDTLLISRFDRQSNLRLAKFESQSLERKAPFHLHASRKGFWCLFIHPGLISIQRVNRVRLIKM